MSKKLLILTYYRILFNFSLQISYKDDETDRAVSIMPLDDERWSLSNMALQFQCLESVESFVYHSHGSNFNP